MADKNDTVDRKKMAERYKNYIVNGGGSKPGFRPLFEAQLGCANIHDLKKDDFINIAVDWDANNFGTFIDDPDIKTKASQAQKDWLYKQVAAARTANQAKAAGTKRAKGGKKATAEPGQAQKAKTAASQRRKAKTKVQKEEAIPSNGVAAEQDQDGDALMANEEDAAEAAPIVDPTADAVSSPHGGKRKRRTPAPTTANKRARTAQSKTTVAGSSSAEPDDEVGTGNSKSLVQLKANLPAGTEATTGSMGTTTQVSSNHPTQEQTAGNMRRTNTQRPLKRPISRLQQGIPPPLELAKSMERNKDTSNDAVAATESPGDAPGASAPDSVPSKPPSRRALPWKQKNRGDIPIRANVPMRDKMAALPAPSDESDELTDSEVESEAPSQGETMEDDTGEDPTHPYDYNDKLLSPEECVKKWFDTEEYWGSPYDEVEAHKRVCEASGNMGSTRDPDFKLGYKGTHKVDGFMPIPPLWLAKTFNPVTFDSAQLKVHYAQKREWERQDAIRAGLPPPEKPVPKKKTKTFAEEALKRGF